MTVITSTTTNQQRLPFRGAEFEYEARKHEFQTFEDEGFEPLLRACEEQRCLVKVIKVHDWCDWLPKLQLGRFRTSLTLLPPHGRGMRLFGKTCDSSTGLIWDRTKLDLSDAFLWPSGYFAKSDYNILADGTLINGRQEALVSLDRIMDDNAKLTYRDELTGKIVKGQVLPFNEVYAGVTGSQGVIGIFVRSLRVRDLLFALGVQALVKRTLPALGALPLVVIDPENGARPFGRTAIRKLLMEYMLFVNRPDMVSEKLLPIDARELILDPVMLLQFHAAYGLNKEALSSCVHRLVQSFLPSFGSESSSARAILLLGFAAAAEAGNGAAAEELLRQVESLLPCNEGYDTLVKPLKIRQGLAPWTPLALVRQGSADFGTYLQGLARVARSRTKIAIGATIVLTEFELGHMEQQVRVACDELEGWLNSASSTFFRVKSWKELSEHHVPHTDPSFLSFLTGKAIENRQVFHDELVQLQHCHDLLELLGKIGELVGHLHHPCLRLQMLQHILGLDAGFDLQQVAEVVKLAFDVARSKGKGALVACPS
eukprot:TRINITY_DN4442_c0_g5_i2.p1 TRINITY_DN4442_c0_g5~~TRINITY_DN4442_c0_g5_i2.p1  ORF type:complete len:562 (+),score=51.46 TRINITY_DN4442_c0_g5_i2:62-1687(+)